MSHVTLTYDDFAPHVGSDFTIPRAESSELVRFKLVEAKPLEHKPNSGNFRDPFQLVFRVAEAEIHPQGIYRLTHPAMGEQDIFLVPAGRGEEGVDYCATFN